LLHKTLPKSAYPVKFFVEKERSGFNWGVFTWGLPRLSERSVDPDLGTGAKRRSRYRGPVGMKHRTGVKFEDHLTGVAHVDATEA